LLVIFPHKKNSLLYFVNPLSNFSDGSQTLETAENPFRFLQPKLEWITDHTIDKYVTLDKVALQRFINLAGGIYFFYDHSVAAEGGLYSRSRGETKIYGEEAYSYLELKETPSPIDYVDRLNKQKSVFLNLFSKLSILGNKFYPEWVEYLHSTIDTNLSISEFIELIGILSGKELLFGIEEPSGELVKNEGTNRTQLKINMDVSKNSFLEAEHLIKIQEYFLIDSARVEILNGTKINGLAKKAKANLNAKNYKVLSTENAWNTNIKTSVIIDRSGKTEYSKRISNILGIKAVIHSIKKETGIDTIVLLGADFETNY
jgi:polyisoprenyl-teichoic acid--peptidoglycan teichoic acid transferase